MVQTREERAPSPDAAPAPPPTRRGTARVAGAAAIVVVVLAALLLLRLGVEERGGPAHTFVSLPNGAPATLYVPRDAPKNGEFPFQPAPERRPPLIVVAHGYSADQNIMSSIARSFARAGYAVLTFDFRGHGANTAAFKGELTADLDAALDWADRSPYVDAGRVGLLGHSMGASAVLEFASRDARPRAVIPLSGGDTVNDAHVPANVLLMAASGDPKVIRDRQAVVQRYLVGKTNVRRVVIDGKDHVTELWSSKMLDQSVRWFDSALGIHRTGSLPGLDDPRVGTAGLYILVVAVLLGFIGWLAGRLVPPSPTTASGGAWVLLVVALLLTLPLLAVGPPSVLPLSEGTVVTSLALTGGMLWGARWFALRNKATTAIGAWVGEGPWLPLRTVLVPGLGAGVAIFVLLTPVGAVFHRLVPTPERLVLWVAVTALLLPFFAAFEAIVRRGRPLPAIGWGLLGRALLLVALVIGVATQTLSPVVGLVIPLLVGLFLLLEVFAAGLIGLECENAKFLAVHRCLTERQLLRRPTGT